MNDLTLYFITSYISFTIVHRVHNLADFLYTGKAILPRAKGAVRQQKVKYCTRRLCAAEELSERNIYAFGSGQTDVSCFFFPISDGATGSRRTLLTDASRRRVTLASIWIHINLLPNGKGCSIHEGSLEGLPGTRCVNFSHKKNPFTRFDYCTCRVTARSICWNEL